MTAVQDAWPQATCYGCGPNNPEGLQIKSTLSPDGQFLLATHHPQTKYNAGFPNVMYGGLVASLIDCHSIWTAITFSYLAEGREIGALPAISFVTGELKVRYIKPTPLNEPILLRAWVEGPIERKVRVLCELGPAGLITATGDTITVRIRDDKSVGAS